MPWVAERFAVPRKPGNAGGGKGPQFKTDAIRGEGPGDWATYQLRNLSRNCRRRCTRKLRRKLAIAFIPCTTRSAARTSWLTPMPSAAPTRARLAWTDRICGHRRVWGAAVARRTGACAQAGDLPTGPHQKSVHTEGQRQTQAAGHLNRAGSGLHDSSDAGAGTDLRSRSSTRAVRLPSRAKRPTGGGRGGWAAVPRPPGSR